MTKLVTLAKTWTIDHVKMSNYKKTVLSVRGVRAFATVNKIQVTQDKRGKDDILRAIAIVHHINYGSYEKKVMEARKKKVGKFVDRPDLLSEDGNLFRLILVITSERVRVLFMQTCVANDKDMLD